MSEAHYGWCVICDEPILDEDDLVWVVSSLGGEDHEAAHEGCVQWEVTDAL